MILNDPLAWLFIATLAVFLSLVTRKKSKYVLLPPGPTPLPIIGNLHQLGDGPPHVVIHKLSQKFGDLVTLLLGSTVAVVVSSADVARDIFKNDDLTISSRPPMQAAVKFGYQQSSMSSAPYGDYWRDVRKIATKELFTLKQIQSFQRIRTKEVYRVMDRLESQISETVDMSATTFRMVNDIVCNVVHGAVEFAIDRQGFMSICHELEALIGGVNIADFIPWMGWINKFNGLDKRMQKCFEKMDYFLSGAVESHLDKTKTKSEHEDIVDVLLRVQKDPDQAIQLTNDQIKGILIDLFVGGTGSTSVTLVWAMTELLKNPKAKHAVEKEVRAVGKGKLRIDDEDLLKLPYLKQVIKETLRLHPPVPLLIPRETIEDCRICGEGGVQYPIPKGTRVIFNTTAIHTDPQHWDNPRQFMPERFADGKVDYRGQHYVLMPFGAGRRGCPGINFALPTIELALANFLYRFDWMCPEGMTVEDIDMQEAVGITVNKKMPLCLVPTLAMN